jgi:hypothetical protein
MATINFEDKIKAWAFPMLLGIVSFFMITLVNKVEKIHADIQMVKETVIEVKVDTRYSKETIKDHDQRLRVLEGSKANPTDNTRVNYEAYKN